MKLKPRTIYREIFWLSLVILVISGCHIRGRGLHAPPFCIYQFPDGTINNGYLISGSSHPTVVDSQPDVILAFYDDTCSYPAEKLESLAYNQEIIVGPFSISVTADDRVYVNSKEILKNHPASETEDRFVFPLFVKNMHNQVYNLGYAEGYKYRESGLEDTIVDFKQPILIVGIVTESQISSIVPLEILLPIVFPVSIVINLWSIYKLRTTRKGHWGHY